MVSVSSRLAALALAAWAIAGLTAGGALAQTHTTTSTLQQTGSGSDDTTPPGTSVTDFAHGPIVNGKQLQPRSGQAPTKDEVSQINRLQPPPDPAANGPLVQPRDLFGNPLGGSPGLDTKKP
ncbi:MAG TPA: hypothetical protein VKQ29_02640 [Aliidongia sp.]|nr:hypothetical protein [Aliidongia sp.]